MALKKTKSGKVDKRTKEYQEMKKNLAKARAAKNDPVKKFVGNIKGLFK